MMEQNPFPRKERGEQKGDKHRNQEEPADLIWNYRIYIYIYYIIEIIFLEFHFCIYYEMKKIIIQQIDKKNIFSDYMKIYKYYINYL